MDHPEDDCVTIGVTRMADSLLNPIIGSSTLKQKVFEGEDKCLFDEAKAVEANNKN